MPISKKNETSYNYLLLFSLSDCYSDPFQSLAKSGQLCIIPPATSVAKRFRTSQLYRNIYWDLPYLKVYSHLQCISSWFSWYFAPVVQFFRMFGSIKKWIWNYCHHTMIFYGCNSLHFLLDTNSRFSMQNFSIAFPAEKLFVLFLLCSASLSLRDCWKWIRQVFKVYFCMKRVSHISNHMKLTKQNKNNDVVLHAMLTIVCKS